MKAMVMRNQLLNQMKKKDPIESFALPAHVSVSKRETHSQWRSGWLLISSTMTATPNHFRFVSGNFVCSSRDPLAIYLQSPLSPLCAAPSPLEQNETGLYNY